MHTDETVEHRAARVAAGYDHRFELVQDRLIELRDAGISFLPAPNGLVACSNDGTPSSIVRMSIPDVLRSADEADHDAGILRVRLDDEPVDRMAEAMALQGDEDACFQEIRNYEALDPQERNDYDQAHGYPSSEYESRTYWRRKAAAAATALAGLAL